ncbi:hypothetical protein PN36_16550 [Candidatus Thiomargarita nelsonii]|uniref:Uncharacterized protein n=1 Tax=Candidatus Thiomargarita nelsonii TaxID=1003181 RepID=A0A0A6PC86_9GAMM|nr:hypothetical protein PN36_16550 [Candidatus Thiomargarita nelsonii]
MDSPPQTGGEKAKTVSTDTFVGDSARSKSLKRASVMDMIGSIGRSNQIDGSNLRNKRFLGVWVNIHSNSSVRYIPDYRILSKFTGKHIRETSKNDVR